MDYPRRELIDHVAGKENLCLNFARQTKMASWQHILVSDTPTPAVFVEIKDGSSIAPLYLYPPEENHLLDISLYPPGKNGRMPNLAPKFVAALGERIGLRFWHEGGGDLKETFGPEDVLHYVYAALHSPAYRARYAPFLKVDFPRISLPTDAEQFTRLCRIGARLTALHLLDPALDLPMLTHFPEVGSNAVDRGYPKYERERVYINAGQYFSGVPEAVWTFQVGGYQVAEKWLKDRRERVLSLDELEQYGRMIAALSETLRLMDEIDE